MNGDTVPEVIVGSWNPAVIVLDGKRGTQLWRTNIGNNAWTVFPITDVDGDGKKDVIAGCGSGNIFCLSGFNGAVVWNYSPGGWVNSVRSIADVNGNGFDDVIAGNQFSSSPGYVYCIAGDSLISGLSEESRSGANNVNGNGKINGVYDITGRQVRDFKPGVYFVVSNEKGKINRKKVLLLSVNSDGF